jgi:DNA-binding MarR family transcriptional regulator
MSGDSVGQLLADWAHERPDLDFSPVGIINRLSRVRTHIDSALLRVFREFDLTSPDFRVIVTLRRAGTPYELPQARLMTQLALTSGTISVRVDRLAKRGIVTRAPDPDDKRGQLVRLTADGLRLFDRIAPLHLANEERLLSSLTPDEQATLARLLGKLLVSFESGTIQVGLPLGMRLEPAHVARDRRTAVGLSDTPGLLVAETIEGTPAAVAGLARGDLIIAVNGMESRSEDVLAEAIDQAGPGGQLLLSVLRGNDSHHVAVHVPGPASDHRLRQARAVMVFSRTSPNFHGLLTPAPLRCGEERRGGSHVTSERFLGSGPRGSGRPGGWYCATGSRSSIRRRCRTWRPRG